MTVGSLRKLFRGVDDGTPINLVDGNRHLKIGSHAARYDRNGNTVEITLYSEEEPMTGGTEDDGGGEA